MANRLSVVLRPGNTKTGPSILTTSGIPYRDCPGSKDPVTGRRDPTCQHCNMARLVKRRPSVRRAWSRSRLEADEACAIRSAPYRATIRVHVAGDFVSRRHIDDVRKALTDRPDLRVWLYTKSWQVRGLGAALNRLATLPNVSVYASVSNKSQEQQATRKGFSLKAYVFEDFLSVPKGAIPCRHDTDKTTCDQCNWCIDGHGSVAFRRK